MDFALFKTVCKGDFFIFFRNVITTKIGIYLLANSYYFFFSVPGTGIEPACLSALEPETSASTNFATRASIFCAAKLSILCKNTKYF